MDEMSRWIHQACLAQERGEEPEPYIKLACRAFDDEIVLLILEAKEREKVHARDQR